MTPDAREIAERIADASYVSGPVILVRVKGDDLPHTLAYAIEAALLSHGDAKIEEAAKLADGVARIQDNYVEAQFAQDIADEIRALKSAPLNPAEQETERE